MELDGLGERFGSDSIFDTRLDPTAPVDDIGSIEEAALSVRYKDDSTRAGALLELDLEREGDWWLRSRGLVRSARSRTRADLDVRGGGATFLGNLTLENRLYAQGGPEGSGAGLQDIAGLTLRRRGLPGGLDLTLRTTGERSWAGEDSLRNLYDYKLVRPSLELARSLGTDGDVLARGGLDRKWTHEDAPGAYTDTWVEAEWIRWIGYSHHWSLLARSESRSYQRSDSLTPSFHESRLEGNLEISFPWKLRTRIQPRFHRTQYAADSEVFQDNWTGDLILKTEAAWGDLFGRGADSLGLDPDWNLALGTRLTVLQSDESFDSDYFSAGGLAGLARDAGGRFWFDLTAEAGRRSYRISGGTQSLVFEGLNISLSGTDYTYLNATFLAEAELGAGISFDLFGMYDQEIHTVEADDFTLWSFSTSLTRRF